MSASTAMVLACTKGQAPRVVQRSPATLHPHPSWQKHKINHSPKLVVDANPWDPSTAEPIYITPRGTILKGFEAYRQACQHNAEQVTCLEYDLEEAATLFWILEHVDSRNGLNHFRRTLLALDLEPELRRRARNNQRAGGLRKLPINLPEAEEAERIDNRREIAKVAGVSENYVDKVRKLIANAPPQILVALDEGEVTIHRAWTWLKKPETQLESLHLHQARHAISTLVDRLQRVHVNAKAAAAPPDIHQLGRALSTASLRNVLIGEIRVPGNLILLSKALLQSLEFQGKLPSP
jgi:hypothetical protein